MSLEAAFPGKGLYWLWDFPASMFRGVVANNPDMAKPALLIFG